MRERDREKEREREEEVRSFWLEEKVSRGKVKRKIKSLRRKLLPKIQTKNW